jgi:hypothetical protein
MAWCAMNQLSHSVGAQRGSCAVTVMPRDTVVVAAGGKLMVITEAEAWQLADALAEVRSRVVAMRLQGAA